MKRTMKDLLFGIVIVIEIFIVLIILEIIILIQYVEPSYETMYPTWDAEMLLTALIVLGTTYGLTGRLKTKSMAEALKRGLIWTCIITLSFILIGLRTDELGLYFERIGIYALLFCAFSGPVIYAKMKHLD